MYPFAHPRAPTDPPRTAMSLYGGTFKSRRFMPRPSPRHMIVQDIFPCTCPISVCCGG
ncbi:unnamed protein product [Periconia digitata]|uniref:Uncharacterized protein n=1 Tax=Periconia digitata TaxID=1303443 RepID=A0A9W4ULX2_9PLEO|nr:unnamed protein product [Periconia digitata]